MKPPFNLPSFPPHKKSNLSSIIGQHNLSNSHQEPTPLHPLKHHDIITIEDTQHMLLTLTNPRKLTPGMLPEESSKGRFALFQILSIKESGKILYGEDVYIRNKESGLYLASEPTILNQFNSLCFDNQKGQRAVFSLQISMKSTKEAQSHQPLQLKHKSSGLYLKTQNSNGQEGQVNLWLGQNSSSFVIKIVNRSQLIPELLNNRDIIMLSTCVREERVMVGVQKHRSFCHFLQKRQPLGQIEASINLDYTSRSNCDITYVEQYKAKGASFMHCLWQVIRPNIGNQDYSFIVRESDQFALRHLQTGLYLGYHSKLQFTLEENQNQLSFSNDSKYQCQFSDRFQPLFIGHNLKIGNPETMVKIQRIEEESRLRLFLQQWLSLVSNMAELLADPDQISQEWQNLQQQIAFYVYVFRLLQREVGLIGDRGYYYFQFALRILQVIRGMLQKTSEEIRRLLGDMLDEMIKFMALIVAGNEALASVTQEDSRKTSEIIYLLFVLYPLNKSYILSLVVCMSSADPRLVITILTKQLQEVGHFHQRVNILQAISTIIDRFRRINLDQQTFRRVMNQQHQLQMRDNNFILIFKGQENSLFDILDQLQQQSKEAIQDDKQTYYRLIYFLEVIRLLYGARSISKQWTLQLRTTVQALNGLKEMTQKLNTNFQKLENIQLKSIVLAFIEEFSSEIQGPEFHNNHHRFILFNGSTLNKDSKLKELLSLSQKTGLQQMMSKQQVTECLRVILKSEWQRGLQMDTQVRYIGRVIDWLSLLLTTYTFDVGFLNSVQHFCIAVSTLFYRKKSTQEYFMSLRNKLCQYQNKNQLLVVEGLKTQLDILVGKLWSIFATILSFKQRLYSHPLIIQPQNILQFSHLQILYTGLCLNQRLSLQIPHLTQLLQLNQGQRQIQSIILTPQSIQNDCFELIQSAISDIESLSIIIESFRLYNQKEGLKENLLASMKLKIINLQNSIKEATKYRQFNKISDSLAVPQLILQFVLENISESQLVQPLAELLFERINTGRSIVKLVSQNRDLIKKALENGRGGKCQKTVLRWIGRQMQDSTLSGQKQWNFLFQDLIELFSSDQQNPAIYYLSSLLLELGLDNPDGRQILYAKMMGEKSIRQFFTSWASSHTLKSYQQRIERESSSRQKTSFPSLELVALFRLCSGQKKLMTHLNSIVCFSEVKQTIFASDDFFFYRPILTYLNCHSDLFSCSMFANQVILFGMRVLKDHKLYQKQIAQYRPRIEKQKDSKAITQYEPYNSHSNNHSREYSKDYKMPGGDTQRDKKYYWQFLYWIPFYRQPQGLLVYLERVLRNVLGGRMSQDIQDSLIYLQQALMQIKKSKVMQVQNSRPLLEQILLLLDLLSLHKDQRDLMRSGTQLSIHRSRQSNIHGLQEIYKLLSQNSCLKQFMKQLSKQNITQMPKTKRTIKLNFSRTSKRKTINRQQLSNQSQSRSNSISIQECTHHSLIRPSKPQKFALKVKKQNRARTIINFMNGIRKLFRNKLKMNCKLQSLLLKFFIEDGTFCSLHQGLAQEINEARVMAIEYKNDLIEYQWGWRTSPLQIGKEVRQLDRQKAGLQVQRMLEVLKSNTYQSLKIVHNILKLHKQNLFELFGSKTGQLQQLFMKIINWKASDKLSLTLVIASCQYISQLLIQLNLSTTFFFSKRMQIYQSLGKLSLLVSNIKLSKQTRFLYVRIALLSVKTMYSLVCHLDQGLYKVIFESILSRLPNTIYRYILLQIMKISIELAANQPQFYTFYQPGEYIIRQIQQIIYEFEQQEQVMAMCCQCEFIRFILDSKQLKLQNMQKNKNKFTNKILWLLIKLQHVLYTNKIKKKLIGAEYQQILISSMSFFHTLSSNTGQKTHLSLFQQRQPFLEGQIPIQDLKETYEYYEKQFEWCLVKLQNGNTSVQVFPKMERSRTWKSELKDVINRQPETSKRRQMLISYCLGVTDEMAVRQQLTDKLDKIEPFLLIISFAFIVAGLLEHIFNPIGIFFICMILFHFLSFSSVVVVRCMMVRVVGETQILMDKEKGWSSIFRDQIGYFLFFIVILVLNLLSYFSSGYLALMLWEILLLRLKVIHFMLKILQQVLKILLLLMFMVGVITIFLAITIDPQYGSQIYPIFGFQTFYNFDFTIVFTNWWDLNLWGSIKLYCSILLKVFTTCVLTAFTVFFYYWQVKKEQQIKNSCQLCCQSRQKWQNDQNARLHIATKHNIFKFIGCFRYIVGKDERRLNLQERRLKKMLIDKKTDIFN